MAILLLFLFKRGPLLLRICAWGFVAAVLYTAAFMLFTRPSDFQKGPIPAHVQHSHVHPSRFVRP